MASDNNLVETKSGKFVVGDVTASILKTIQKRGKDGATYEDIERSVNMSAKSLYVYVSRLRKCRLVTVLPQSKTRRYALIKSDSSMTFQRVRRIS
jgi:DNA-binding IclR family transcriptional regulator